MKKNDKRIRKYVTEIITVLPTRKDNQKRELLKILDNMEIKEELEGLVFSNCVSIWEALNKQPSVRFNAFKLLVKIAQKHPEMHREVVSFTNAQYTSSLSSAVNKSIAKLIKDIS